MCRFCSTDIRQCSSFHCTKLYKPRYATFSGKLLTRAFSVSTCSLLHNPFLVRTKSRPKRRGRSVYSILRPSLLQGPFQTNMLSPSSNNFDKKRRLCPPVSVCFCSPLTLCLFSPSRCCCRWRCSSMWCKTASSSFFKPGISSSMT